MKRSTYFFNLCIALMLIFSSCTKTELDTRTDVINSDKSLSESLAEVPNSLLTFSSIEELEETINKLLVMGDDERHEWYTLKGFTSAQQILELAEKDLVLIKNIEDVKLYKNKYSKYFIFDNNDIDVSANPYLRIGKFGYSYVCNINGDVVINGEVCNFNDLTSYKETSDYKNSNVITKSDPSNKVTRIEKKRKFWAEAKRVGDNVYIEFYGRKKVAFSWSDYHTTYTTSYKYANDHWVYVNQTNPSTFGLFWLVGSRGIKDGPRYPFSTPEVKGRYTVFFDIRAKDSQTIPGMIIYPDAIAEVYVSCRSELNGVLRIEPNLL